MRGLAVLVAIGLPAQAAQALAQPAVTPPSSPAPAPPAASDPGTVLRDANRALVAGDWQGAEALLQTLPRSLSRADAAEARRIAGLSAFFGGRLAEAERFLLAYLRYDLDARLDPAVTPPEAVTFFEDIRARHGAELRALRPRPRTRGSWALNLLPPLGQFQNGDRTRGWIFAGTELTLLAVNLGSYITLRRWCDEGDGTCGTGDGRTSEARRMRTINLATGVGFLAVYAVGVIDGWVGYRGRNRALEVQVVPTPGGAALVLSGQM